MLTNDPRPAVARGNRVVGVIGGGDPLTPIWNGILHEFRNHLTVVLAAATEARAGMPSAAGPGVADALAQVESNVGRMNALLAFMDAALRDGPQMVSDLDDAIERALRLAAPMLERVAVKFDRQRRIGVGNRGNAFEALVAALLIDLVRADGRRPEGTGRLQIDVRAEVVCCTVLLDIESSGRHPPADSWRMGVASELAAHVGATVALNGPPERAGYTVRLA